MAEHYANAACRHLSDSKILLDASSWDGSAYLAGYVIECSLKAIIANPAVPPGIELKELGHDLAQLRSELDKMASSRQAARKRNVSSQLLSFLRVRLETMQPMWKPAMRYASADPDWKDQAAVFWGCANRCFHGFAQALVTEVKP